MEPYKNLSGASPVTGFSIAPSHIDVQYADSAVYRYSHITPGRDHVERMKDLARGGKGLAAYICTHIYGYEPTVFGFQPKKKSAQN